METIAALAGSLAVSATVVSATCVNSQENTSEGPGCDGLLRSKMFGKGGCFEHAFDMPGEFVYFCEANPFTPFMKDIEVVL